MDYDGFHDIIPFRVRGMLPAAREKMLEKLDNAIQVQQQKPPLVAVV